MSLKTRGIILTFVIAFACAVLSLIAAAIVSVMAENSWNGLLVGIIMLSFSGILMIAILIGGILKYKKNHSEFFLGIIYGTIIILVLVTIIPIITVLFDVVITLIGS